MGVLMTPRGSLMENELLRVLQITSPSLSYLIHRSVCNRDTHIMGNRRPDWGVVLLISGQKVAMCRESGANTTHLALYYKNCYIVYKLLKPSVVTILYNMCKAYHRNMGILPICNRRNNSSFSSVESLKVGGQEGYWNCCVGIITTS